MYIRVGNANEDSKSEQGQMGLGGPMDFWYRKLRVTPETVQVSH